MKGVGLRRLSPTYASTLPAIGRNRKGAGYACQPGLGVHETIAQVQANLRRLPWFAKVDVDGYFPSIDHACLKQLLARRFKGDDFLALLARIIDLCPGHERESVRQVLAELRVWLVNERRLRLKATFEINRSERGVTWCGARVLRGALRLTPRKQRRYRQGCWQWEAAWLAGEINSLALQRGYDAVYASTLHSDSATWRKRHLELHPSRYSER